MNFENPNFDSEKKSFSEGGERFKSEKEIAWEEKRAEVDQIADSLGLGVDEKIKETVAAFRICEFPTSGSCEGHIQKEGEKERGHSFPWIDVYAPEPEGLDDEQREKKWTAENLKQRQRMTDYLSEFYKDRETPFDARLVFSRLGIYGAFRVQSFGAETMDIFSPEEKLEKRELYRKEMNDFAGFLKEKYFLEKN